MMNPQTVLIGSGLIAYGAASVMGVFSLLRPFRFQRLIGCIFMCLGAILLCGVWCDRLMMREVEMGFGRFESLTLYAIIMSLAYLVLVQRRETQLIAGLLAPLVTITLLLGEPLFATPGDLHIDVRTAWLGTHVGTALFSYALFSLAAVVAVAYLLQDHNLKQKKLDGIFTRLPSLERLDRLMAWQVGIAFLTLTVSIVLGVILVRLTGGAENWISDPKIVATSVAWIVYAMLVHLRATTGRRGRNLAVVCIAGALCMMFAFLGGNMLSSSVHQNETVPAHEVSP